MEEVVGARAVAEHGGSAGTETARTRGWQQSPCLAPSLPRAQAAEPTLQLNPPCSFPFGTFWWVWSGWLLRRAVFGLCVSVELITLC